MKSPNERENIDRKKKTVEKIQFQSGAITVAIRFALLH